MEKFTLTVNERKVFGKKAQKLRKDGWLLGNIFGKNFKSLSVAVPFREFWPIFKKAKKTHLVYLNLGKEEIPVLVKNLQHHPLDEHILHIDFQKMDLKIKTETAVPVVYEGETEVVKSGEADVLLLADAVLVNCLPTEIPEKIVIDVTKLKEVGDEIRVKDLPKISNVEFVDEPEKLILQIAAAQKEEIPAPTPAAEGAAPEAEGKTEEVKTEAKESETKKEGKEQK
jgi:large subunit ribosomal protein L25